MGSRQELGSVGVAPAPATQNVNYFFIFVPGGGGPRWCNVQYITADIDSLCQD